MINFAKSMQFIKSLIFSSVEKVLGSLSDLKSKKGGRSGSESFAFKSWSVTTRSATHSGESMSSLCRTCLSRMALLTECFLLLICL